MYAVIHTDNYLGDKLKAQTRFSLPNRVSLIQNLYRHHPKIPYGSLEVLIGIYQAGGLNAFPKGIV